MTKVQVKKPWYKSKTIIFLSAVLAAGGTDLIVSYLQGEMDWRTFAILFISMTGIILRLITTDPVTYAAKEKQI